jgi:AcrR family transcriptional regulator
MVNKTSQAATAPVREPPGGSGRRRRGRGRPRGASAGNVRERLLHAARELFLRYGYRAVSSRQIGAAAGVNFAMIRYYFGGKPGLYREILQSLLPPQLTELEAWADAGGAALPEILASQVRMWAANPWVAGFVLREVLVPGGPMRTMFLREFPERLAPLVERVVRAQMRRGTLRPDLDPKLLVLSMVSLGIFPFLAFALTSRVFGVRHDEEFVSRFLAHTQALLAHGIAPTRPADSDARAGAAPVPATAPAAPHPNSASAASVHAVVARTRERQ